MDRLMERLAEYGIHNAEELDKAIREISLNIGPFVNEKEEREVA